ncbi:MAG: class I SAM-dependent methyltransferase [Lachnospiraceae bacterium]|nr:class I SAM-dependent methyltransferase [Ruminococcus sp.]MCM1276199.1 class I SAM-dependent methyltransferase [Lachnospiraceae bacterium]
MNEQKFTGKAELYEKFRPSYPDGLIDFLYGNARCDNVADIGAGTGKFTRCLLKKPWNVTAVEPNADMRSKLADVEGITIISAPAEETGLPDGSVGLVTAAQAFHWFDEERFKAECKRILTPNGQLAVIYNERSYDGCEIASVRDEICRKYCGAFHSGHVGKRSGEEGDRFLRNEYFSEVKVFSCSNDVETDIGGFVGDTLSRSYALKEGDDNFKAFVGELENVFTRFAKNGKVTVKYNTNCYLGSL